MTVASNAPPMEYLIFDSKKVGILDLLRCLFLRRTLTSCKFVKASTATKQKLDVVHVDWITLIVLCAQKFLSFIKTPLALLGRVVEFLLNFYSNNGGIWGIIKAILTVSLKIPQPEDADYRSIIGHIDGRGDLHSKCMPLFDFSMLMDQEAGSQEIPYLDLCMIAAKIAYENEAYIRNAVTENWKMHFVGFYNCWNESSQARTTQAFVCLDRAVDANLIVVAFRGTEPFNAADWSTDIDLSFTTLGLMGTVHAGFLYALGFKHAFDHRAGLPKEFSSDDDKPLAYYVLKEELASLLQEHKNAKILVTGHSLGGALAILFPALLELHKEHQILSSMQGVMTFGQPRVGDNAFGLCMKTRPWLKYHRMVYSYDLVPRVPSDMPLHITFKHFGTCIYYDGWYRREELKEVPNQNYFDPLCTVIMYLKAWADLVNGIKIASKEGEDYKEGIISILFRALGLVIPGIASHSPRDYVNAGRLSQISSSNKMPM